MPEQWVPSGQASGALEKLDILIWEVVTWGDHT